MNRKNKYFYLALALALIPLFGAWLVVDHQTVWAKPEGTYSRNVALTGDPETAAETFNLVFSTYIGGSGEEFVRDVAVDAQGNIVAVGGTASTDFPTTLGPGINNGDCPSLGSIGRMDAFVMKFDPQGKLLWSQLIGGPCYERAYAVEVDSQGFIYVGGRAGPGFPVTPNALQTTFQGQVQSIYGQQNAFLTKLKPDGSILWASYLGVGPQVRDLAIDANGDIYTPLTYIGQGGVPPAGWFANAFIKTPPGGEDTGAAKIKSDGSRVIWATWLGGSNDDTMATSIRVDGQGQVHLALSTVSRDIPTTGSGDQSYNGGKQDFYVAKLSADGSSLLFGTYLGGSGNDLINTHNLALDSQSNVYVSIWTDSTDFPTTPGVRQSGYAGGNSDIVLAKLSPSGALLQSTYLGGRGSENPDGLYIDASGNLFMTGQSDSPDFPITPGATQTQMGGQSDAVLVRVSADFKQLLYSSFFGGSSVEDGRTGFLAQGDILVLAGTADGRGWPVKNAFQSAFAGGPNDGTLVRFTLSGSGQPPSGPPIPPPGGTPIPPVDGQEHNYLPFTIRPRSGAAGNDLLIPQTGGTFACSERLAR